ncbi:uncharacterized protein LOC114742641 [Neltuma alba]|uniref:uncharacterized protein LOC114730144 n=1 Tax=Neltuma alba TaxID=207710 RepID=UPI0010A482A0|nr:uncharacterized protein LOC114730144 [Prosopis alba]XP_028786693.1 uncharacterized protein LOC114742641 [Prosopis alba]
MVVERYYFFHHRPPAATLEILAFDTANTMRRLVSLYNSLTDAEVSKLCNHTINSKGVVYLNSKQECFLLNLACAERLEELDVAAATVSQLGRKCSDPGLNQFHLVYADLKAGMINTRKLQFGSRSVLKSVEKMEKLVLATAKLHDAMVCLADMEASEKKVQHWKALGCKNFGYRHQVNIQTLCDQIAFQRKQVRRYKELSLWNQTFDKAVRLMVRIVFIIYARICSVFEPYISGLPTNDQNFGDCYCLLEHRELYQTNCCLTNRVSKSGPISKTNKSGPIRFVPDEDDEIAKSNRVLKMASPSTVGGAGLSFRYASVIMFAERCLHSPGSIGESEREALYEMLPERLKEKVRKKMRGQWLKGEEWEEGGDGRSPAEGWREAVEEIMEWLTPVARDTTRWQAERSMEKQRYDGKPTTLLLQTLHYSDLDKAEAAIVEVLVGLSCIFKYEKRRRQR